MVRPDQAHRRHVRRTTVEALRDGPLAEAWLAQPSGLAVSTDGSRLWVADSETSAIRYVENGVLGTAVGQGLFDFGHVDGPAAQALLQHPLGVCALPDGSVLIADTYNGAVRRYDPADDRSPPSPPVWPSPATWYSPPTARCWWWSRRRIGSPGWLPVRSRRPRGDRRRPRHRTERRPTELSAGEVVLDVVFTPAPGQKLDDTFGPSTRLVVSASPPELLVEGAGTGTELSRRLVIDGSVPDGVLQVTAQAATCDADVEHAACHLTRQDWGVPVRVVDGGVGRLPLVLRGMDAG